MQPTTELGIDPWTVGDTRRPPAATSALPRAAAACVLGSSGVIARLWTSGVDARRAALVLAVAGVLLEVALRRRRVGAWWTATPIVGIVVAGEAVTVPLAGRAPALLLAVSVAVADAALVAWRPTRGWPQRPMESALLAVPILAAAQVVWFRTGSLVWFVGLLASGAGVVELYHRWPSAVVPADRGFRRAVAALADAVGAAALLVVALPFLYLPGAIGRLLGVGQMGRRHRSGRPAWRSTTPSAAEARGDAGVPFVTPDRSAGRRRHLVALGVVVVVAVATVAVVRSDRDTPAPVAAGAEQRSVQPGDGTSEAMEQLDLLEFVPYSERAAMQGLDFADALQRDFAAVKLLPDDELGYVTADTATRYVNVAGGERRSVTGLCHDCPRVTAWLVGGSAAFGTGQRDDHTVASELVRLAASDGVDLRIRNLGVVGWSTHQEALDVRRRLAAGEEPPDLVVALDGFNDAMAAVARGLAGRLDDPAPLTLDRIDIVRALESDERMAPERVESVAHRAAEEYRRSGDAVREVLEPSHTRFVRFFQPDAFASQRQLDAVRQLYRTVPGLLDRDEIDAVIDRVIALLGDEVVDVRDAHGAVREPVYFDMVHTNEVGARVLAEAVYPSLRAWFDGATP